MAFPSDTLISNLGEASQSGSDDYALFLKRWAGEILEVQKTMTVMEPLVQFKRLVGAKTAQFPGIGKIDGGYHTTGNSIYDSGNGILQDVLHDEITVHIDRPLMTAVALDELEEIINHYDARAPYSRAIGKFFAEKMDVYLMRLAILGSQGTQGAAGLAGVTTDHPSGNYVEASGADTSATTLLGAIKDASELMDAADVPDEGRVVIVKPAQYNLLADPASQLTDRDFGGEGNGRTADGTVFRAWGFRVMKSNLLPQDNSTAVGTGATSESVVGQNDRTYVTNARKTAALCYHPMCLGAVEAMPLQVATKFEEEYQSHFVIGKRATGMQILRPEAGVVIRTGDPATA